MKKLKYSFVVIEGPIGVGKSSLATRLAEHFQSELMLENITGNPFLKSFYGDIEKNAFTTQLYFLLSRFRQLKSANQPDLFKKTIFSDYMLEKDFIFAELNLKTEEFNLYNDVYKLLKGQLAKPDLVIFLTAGSDTLVKRVDKRGRKIEDQITEDYIGRVNEAYHSFFFRYDNCPILQVNTNDIDFVNNDEDFKKLLEELETPIRGKQFFNPLGSS